MICSACEQSGHIWCDYRETYRGYRVGFIQKERRWYADVPGGTYFAQSHTAIRQQIDLYHQVVSQRLV